MWLDCQQGFGTRAGAWRLRVVRRSGSAVQLARPHRSQVHLGLDSAGHRRCKGALYPMVNPTPRHSTHTALPTSLPPLAHHHHDTRPQHKHTRTAHIPASISLPPAVLPALGARSSAEPALPTCPPASPRHPRQVSKGESGSPYELRASVGPQADSKKKNKPNYAFGTSQRFGVDRNDLRRSAAAPGPGSYAMPKAVETQQEATKSITPRAWPCHTWPCYTYCAHHANRASHAYCAYYHY